MVRYVNKIQAELITGLGSESLKRYRLKGDLIEGIHWVYLNSRTVRYNSDLLADWVANRGDAQAHQIAIEQFRKSLASGTWKRTR